MNIRFAILAASLLFLSFPSVGQDPSVNGDFNGDGIAGPSDLLELIEGFGQPVSSGSGNLVWAKRAYSPSIDGGNGVAVGSAGEVYVVGNWRNGMILGEGETTETTLTGTSGFGGFLAHYASTGDFSWARATSSGGDISLNGVAVQTSNNTVFATGRYDFAATFWSEGTPQFMLDPGGSGDIFLCRASSDGTMEALDGAGGTGYQEGHIVDALPDGTHIQMGLMSESATFGEGESAITLELSSGRNPFLVKYNPDGTPMWGFTIPISLFSSLYDAALLPDGRVAVVGRYSSSLTLGAGEANETTLTAVGSNDTFVALYNSDGTLVWARSDGGNMSDEARGVSVLPNDGGIVYCGRFSDVATFGEGTPGVRILTSTDSTDVFVAKYDLQGNLAWAKRAGGFGTNLSNGIGATPDGGAVVVGTFQDTCTFGTGEPNETSLVAEGDNDGFVAKYQADGGLIWAKNIAGPGTAQPNDVAVHSDGTSVVVGSFNNSAIFGVDETGEITLESGAVNETNTSVFVAKFAP